MHAGIRSRHGAWIPACAGETIRKHPVPSSPIIPVPLRHSPPEYFCPHPLLSNAPEPFSVRRGVLLRGAFGAGGNPVWFLLRACHNNYGCPPVTHLYVLKSVAISTFMSL